MKELRWIASSRKDLLNLPDAVRDDWHGDTYRVVYSVRFEQAIYVLHCFQKKSTQGIATPQFIIELIHKRLKLAEADARRSLS